MDISQTGTMVMDCLGLLVAWPSASLGQAWVSPTLVE